MEFQHPHIIFYGTYVRATIVPTTFVSPKVFVDLDQEFLYLIMVVRIEHDPYAGKR
jgi:hypothetical protein